MKIESGDSLARADAACGGGIGIGKSNHVRSGREQGHAILALGSIDEHSRTVNMDIVRFRTKHSETMGKLKAELVSAAETQFGEPIYVFNTIPAAGVEVTNLFKLFKSLDDWRLISAGVTSVGNIPALRAIESSAVFHCKRS